MRFLIIREGRIVEYFSSVFLGGKEKKLDCEKEGRTFQLEFILHSMYETIGMNFQLASLKKNLRMANLDCENC